MTAAPLVPFLERGQGAGGTLANELTSSLLETALATGTQTAASAGGHCKGGSGNLVRLNERAARPEVSDGGTLGLCWRAAA